MGLTQLELAYASQLSPEHIGNVERGTTSPTVETAAKIAKGLGVPMDRLLDLEEAGETEASVTPLDELTNYLRERPPEDSALALSIIRQILTTVGKGVKKLHTASNLL
jgi:transcriptional regulator with XRE-family HTH domain